MSCSGDETGLATPGLLNQVEGCQRYVVPPVPLQVQWLSPHDGSVRRSCICQHRRIHIHDNRIKGRFGATHYILHGNNILRSGSRAHHPGLGILVAERKVEGDH
jgi:hypothetical protein